MKFSQNDKPNAELKRIRSISALVGEKLKQSKKEEKILDNLSYEELQDLNKILQLADFILCKNEDNKEFCSFLKEFVGMIKTSSNSLTELDDEISEMVLSAENSLSRIKELQNNVSTTYSFESEKPKLFSKVNPNFGANNLTKSSTPVYTQEYQANSTVDAGQVI